MKKIMPIVFAMLIVLGALPAVTSEAAAAEETVHYESFQYNKNEGYDYDITGCCIALVKQSTGALVWAPADDARSDAEIIEQAKGADSSLAHAVRAFAVLKGEGTLNTPNKNGSKAKVTVYTDADGKLILSIKGEYSHFGCGTSAAKPEEPIATPVAPTTPDTPVAPISPEPEEGEKASIRVDAPKKMAVKFADGTVYYGGEMKELVFGKEYMFQMVSVNWENGCYDEGGNGICGTVVYKVKVVHANAFRELRKEALNDSERYTVKGIDIIDNDAKTIIINGDAGNAHLETDVNNFFVAYRFHFKNGDYNKQTGIGKVVNKPMESLSVNLPLGTTVICDAYKADQSIDSGNVFITRNNGEGRYADEHLSSVNDYYWNH